MDANSLAFVENELPGTSTPEPEQKKAKVMRATDEDGAPTFTQDDVLDNKGLDACLRKVAKDKLTSDMWKAKAKSIIPTNIGEEMAAAISDDQDKLQAIMNTISGISVAKQVN